MNRTVSFNIEDPFQAQLLQAVDDWTNFSGNVKRLIAASLNGGTAVHVQSYTPVVQEQGEAILNESGALNEWDPTELF